MRSLIFFALIVQVYGLQANELLRASAKGDVELVKSCIARGDYLEPKNNMSYTPLLMAARFGHVEAVKLLLTAGANVNATTYYGLSAIEVYIGKDDAKDRAIVLELLKSGAPYENMYRYVENLIGEDPDSYVANHFRKVLREKNISFSQAFIEASTCLLEQNEVEKAKRAAEIAKYSNNVEPNNTEIARLLGCAIRIAYR